MPKFFTHVIAFLMGAVAGAMVSEKHDEASFNKALDEEVEHYRRQVKELKALNEKLLEDLKLQKDAENAVKNYGGNGLSENIVIDPNAVRDSNLIPHRDTTIFGETLRDFKKKDVRDPDKPYVITEEEFMLGERNYNTSTVTYYAGDGTLGDERDEIVDGVDQMVGINNLNEMIKNPDVTTIYIRNERLALDIEVIRSNGKYAEEVLGQMPGSDTAAIGGDHG